MSVELFKYGLENGQFPQILYKYRTFKQLKWIFENPALKFSKPSEFNDPFECKCIGTENIQIQDVVRYLLGQGVDKMIALKKASEMFNDKVMLKRVIQGGIDDIAETLGILCLSEENDNILLWSHYADNHKGVCLEFDLSEDLETFDFPKNIEYSNNYPVFNYLTNPSDATKMVFHKSNHWAYEKEWRVVKLGKTGLLNFNPKALVAIHLGCKCDKLAEIRTMISAHPEFSHVRLTQAVQDERTYSLIFNNI